MKMKVLTSQWTIWYLLYILGYHELKCYVDARNQDAQDKSYVMQIGSKYIRGLQFDHSLCRIFQPTLQRSSVTFDKLRPFSGIEDVSRFDNNDKKYYITKMSPRITRNPHYEDGLSPVRFIILNRCNPEDRRAANLLERWSKESGSVQCQSQDFFAAMKNCHDEQLFIWSSKSKRTDGRIESTGEEFPEGYGIDFRQEYYMMMIIYEYVDTELIDNSGLELFYRETSRHERQQFWPVKRILIGQQAIHKHIMLSGLDGWLTMGVCSRKCTSTNAQTREIISVDVHTRYLGSGVRVDIGYQDLRRTSSDREYMLDVPLLPDVPLNHQNKRRNSVHTNHKINETIQTVRRRFWDAKTGNNFYHLLPGDDIIVKCAYSTREEIQPTFGGMQSNEEVCFAFISYVQKDSKRDVTFGEQDKNQKLEHDFEYNFDGDLTTCMSSPAYDTITDALKLEQFGHEDGDVVSSGTRKKRKNRRPNSKQTTNFPTSTKETFIKYHFLPENNKDSKKTSYVRFEDDIDDNLKKLEPRRKVKSGRILSDGTSNTESLLTGAAEVFINATQNILLNSDSSSDPFVFLSSFLSKPNTISNDRVTTNQEQTNIENFIDGIDDYDHKSGYSQKKQANGAIMRGIHQSACIRTHPEIFGFRKVAIRKQFYIYGGKDQRFKRKPRKLNQNIPLLMDSSGFKVQSSASHCFLSSHISTHGFKYLILNCLYIKMFNKFLFFFKN